jgi:acetyltransferase-like isoleucine patch superfamily enzyme
MFSHGIVIRTSDDHAIIDMDTSAHLNPVQDIHIEPYVWLCLEVQIQKGVCIGFGSIVAARASVTNDVESFAMVGGVPARVLRENVSWDRPSIPGVGRHQAIRMMARNMN